MFDIGPSPNSRLQQRTGGIARQPMKRPAMGPRPPMSMGVPGMARPPMMQRPPMGQITGDAPFGMGPMPNMGQQPVSTTMPVGGPRPSLIPVPTPFGNGNDHREMPMEENPLWRTYNRLSGNPTASRMLF